jgi:hypothetical protein
MRAASLWVFVVASAFLPFAACKGTQPARLATAVATSVASAPSRAAIDASPAPAAIDDVAPEVATLEVDPVRPADQTGPFEIPLVDRRMVYFTAPNIRGPARLLAMLHGLCNPPGYTCGSWQNESKDIGFLVCPTGDGNCGPMLHYAPTWIEPWSKMDDDLELAIAKVDAMYPGEVVRNDSVLLGFSRGAYVAPYIACRHPGRWPYLVLIEADVELSAKLLTGAGVRAVAMLAGDVGNEIRGEKRTVDRLQKDGYPAKFWAMPAAGHFYSANIATLLPEAIAWVTEHGEPSPQNAGD